jgi:general secretion pathway protein E
LIKIESLKHLKLTPYEPQNVDIDLAIKSKVVFTKIDDTIYACTTKDNIVIATGYYNKLSADYNLKVIDELSFDRLYSNALAIKKEKKATNIDNTAIKSNKRASITDLLKISSDILSSDDQAPVIEFVNNIFYQAYRQKASDIHIHMYEDYAQIRFRIDGVLSSNIEIAPQVAPLIINRIKVISNLDISQKRLPQDGRTQINIQNSTLDIRVSIMPTFYGERVVMRVLMQSDAIPKIDELGFDTETQNEIKDILTNPHGIVLVTGPTGSGKSTSLHSFIEHIHTNQKHIVTVEDPVEYKSNKISQTQINEKIGLTFATALRSILRQDPDVILIGEIRDEKSASIAIRASLTGHLVFSTLHTNSAVATISRLLDMGIEPFLIASAIKAIISQRLVRKLCNKCKSKDIIDSDTLHSIGIDSDATIYRSVGCDECNHSGYSGRVAICEVMRVDKEIKDIIKSSADEQNIKDILAQKGSLSIPHRVQMLILDGTTSIHEAMRIGILDE